MYSNGLLFISGLLLVWMESLFPPAASAGPQGEAHLIPGAFAGPGGADVEAGDGDGGHVDVVLQGLGRGCGSSSCLPCLLVHCRFITLHIAIMLRRPGRCRAPPGVRPPAREAAPVRFCRLARIGPAKGAPPYGPRHAPAGHWLVWVHLWSLRGRVALHCMVPTPATGGWRGPMRRCTWRRARLRGRSAS